jgi:hypothetical protein
VKICPVCSTEFPDDVRFCPNDGQTLLASSAGHDLVGQVVADRYHVVKKLGEGGMGQVYLAEHVKMGRRSAMKVQKVTKTGLVVGTPEFMSPEQLSGDKLDGRSDVYSRGLVLFKMLTGVLPFAASTVQETMIKRLTHAPATLAQVRPDLRFPAGLQETLATALARSPVDRYQSALQFANDVAALLGMQRSGVRAPLPSTRADANGQTQLLRPAPGRKRSLVPVVVGAVVVLGGAGAVLVLRGGGKRADGAIPADTASRMAANQPPDTGRSRVTPAPPTVRAGLDPAKAGDLLDALIDRPSAVILDSALVIYNTPGVTAKDRAFAACLLARTYQDGGDRAQALRWAGRGLALDATLKSCQQVAQGGP